jgi:hypothetical protein
MPNSLRDNSTTGLYVGAAVFKMFNRIWKYFQSTFDWNTWILLDVVLEIIRILVFQQFHENIDAAMGHLASSKPTST